MNIDPRKGRLTQRGHNLARGVSVILNQEDAKGSVESGLRGRGRRGDLATPR